MPQTIARETAQKTNWKNHFDSIVASESAITGKLGWNSVVAVRGRAVRAEVEKKKPPSCPMKLPSGPPKANTKPTAHQQIAAMQKLVRIFATTVPAFFALREADLQEGEPGLHEHDQRAGDDHPQRVDADRLLELAGDRPVEIRGVGERARRDGAASPAAPAGSPPGTSSSLRCPFLFHAHRGMNPRRSRFTVRCHRRDGGASCL